MAIIDDYAAISHRMRELQNAASIDDNHRDRGPAARDNLMKASIGVHFGSTTTKPNHGGAVIPRRVWRPQPTD